MDDKKKRIIKNMAFPIILLLVSIIVFIMHLLRYFGMI